MSILVINSGSTSIKYKLFTSKNEEAKQGEIIGVTDHQLALRQLLREVGGLPNLRAVGHRVVHGGGQFVAPVLINDRLLVEIEKFNYLAPLHNPYNLAAIKAVREYLPDLPQVAVFDTSFYSTLPETASHYALPEDVSKKYNIKRFGFHGTSHKYVMLEAANFLKKDASKINLITCHLGGGWSVTAIASGKAVDTSMGWTPLEGLVMMTRSGDLDPSIVLELVRRSVGETTEEKCRLVGDLLNHHSGIKGLSGITDYKKLLRLVNLGDRAASLAFELAVGRLVKYIGAYWAVLGGRAEAVVFTGAIGAGDPLTRERVIAKLGFLKKTKFLVIPTDEELMIAREVRELVNNF